MEHTIRKGNTVAVISDLGGTVTTFTKNGADLFFPQRTRGEKMRGGCPICAQWFGSSSFGPKKHGHLRDSVPCTRRIGDASVDLGFYLPGTELYPWSMKCSTRVIVFGNMLELSLQMERLADGIPEAAPVRPAFHPYFPFPADKTEVVIGNNVVRGFSKEARSIPLNRERRIIIRTPQREIEMRLLDDFLILDSQIILWTDSPDEYVCVEPVIQSKEVFGTEKGLHLEEGQLTHISVTFQM